MYGVQKKKHNKKEVVIYVVKDSVSLVHIKIELGFDILRKGLVKINNKYSENQ